MNAELLDKLERAVAPRQLKLADFCGSQSALAKCLRDPFNVTAHRQQEPGDQALSGQLERLHKVLAELAAPNWEWSGPPVHPSSRFRAQGLSLLFSAALARQVSPAKASHTNDAKLLLEQGIEALTNAFWHGAWSEGVARNRVDVGAVPEENPAKSDAKRLALGVAGHIQKQWGVWDRQPGPAPLTTVCTPLLGAAGEEGVVLWLHVELYKLGKNLSGELVPDLLGMGLTGVNDRFLAAFAEAWKATQLGSQVYGVWRIDTNPPPGFLPGKPSGLELLRGPSAQAALLVALLAATGYPDEYEPPPSQPAAGNPPASKNLLRFDQRGLIVAEPLDLKTALSATVDFQAPAESIRARKLTSVGQVPTKAEGAVRQQLDTAVFFKDEALAPEFQESEKGTRAAQQGQLEPDGEPYRGLWIERAATVEEAVDLLLERNKYLRAYQASIQTAWDDLWLPEEPATPAGNSSESAEHV
jgi:hypothetical protein